MRQIHHYAGGFEHAGMADRIRQSPVH
jgi:hypothetical protein